MGRLLKVIVAVMAIIAIVALAVAAYLLQYDNLEIGVDTSRTTGTYVSPQGLELRIVFVLTNTGDADLVVPPTTFDLFVDGVYAGPGESVGVTVPARGSAWSTAIVAIDSTTAPAAYIALVDPGQDTIRLIGEAHVDVGPVTLDFPFDESFKMDL